jgi:hypothetical protein
MAYWVPLLEENAKPAAGAVPEEVVAPVGASKVVPTVDPTAT